MLVLYMYFLSQALPGSGTYGSIEHRQLLLFAPAPDNALLKRQLHLLSLNEPGMKERDIIVHTYLASEGMTDSYTRYRVKVTKFCVMLIGKDATEKFRCSKPVNTEELFSLIDAMPMRKAEIKRRKL